MTTVAEWKKFVAGMLAVLAFALCLGAAIGSCRGAATVVQRLMEGR